MPGATGGCNHTSERNAGGPRNREGCHNGQVVAGLVYLLPHVPVALTLDLHVALSRAAADVTVTLQWRKLKVVTPETMPAAGEGSHPPVPNGQGDLIAQPRRKLPELPEVESVIFVHPLPSEDPLAPLRAAQQLAGQLGAFGDDSSPDALPSNKTTLKWESVNTIDMGAVTQDAPVHTYSRRGVVHTEHTLLQLRGAKRAVLGQAVVPLGPSVAAGEGVFVPFAADITMFGGLCGFLQGELAVTVG